MLTAPRWDGLDEAVEHEEWDVGRRVRIMWDGPGMPLWDDVNGRMPEEIEFFLAGFLLLSQNLIDDLRSWGEAEPGWPVSTSRIGTAVPHSSRPTAGRARA